MVADPSLQGAGSSPTEVPACDPPGGAAARDADPGLGAKVAFLSRPGSYPEPTARVDTIETHMSWVFLTDRQAWKLKKPVRTTWLDFTTAAARRRNCEAELRLNRRLATDVYLEIVPLALDDGGRLRLGDGGGVIDWLVRMRRLPAARMLDRLIARGEAHDGGHPPRRRAAGPVLPRQRAGGADRARVPRRVRRGQRREPARAPRAGVRAAGAAGRRRLRAPGRAAALAAGTVRRARARRAHRRGARRPAARARLRRGRAADHRLPGVLARAAHARRRRRARDFSRSSASASARRSSRHRSSRPTPR